MRAISRIVLVAALFIGLVPVTASAQRYVVDWGINGGFSWYSQMLDETEAGFEGARFKAGWLLGSQLTFWPSARVGVRANMTYSERPLVSDDDLAHLEDNVLHGNVNLWSGSGDLLFRFRAPNESWMGRETLPYLAIGFGGKWVNPAADPQLCQDNEEQKSWECASIHPANNVILAVGERSVPMGLIGLGADFRMSPRVALRLEVNDRIYKPPVYRVQTLLGNVMVLANSDERATVWTHEVGAQIGLHFLLGLRTPPVVAVQPPPAAPPPPPAPPPAAPPPPREDAITICVVDPSAPGGLRMQTATFRHEQRDTVVTVDGQRRAFREVVPTGVMVARDAGWYVRGEPVTLTVGRENVRWLPYQSATVIQASRLVYLGNVGGFPVYADRDEVADVIETINTARAGRTDVELGTLLATNARARDVVQRASFLYVPLDRFGCVFQPIQRQEDVRKGGKQ